MLPQPSNKRSGAIGDDESGNTPFQRENSRDAESYRDREKSGGDNSDSHLSRKPHGYSGKGYSGGSLPVNWKPGDWLCPACNDHVFARKDHCRCGEAKPSAQQQQAQSQPQSQQPAQQPPVIATYHAPATAPPPHFSRSQSLTGTAGTQGNFRPGDWICSVCDGHVYASKPQCRCGATKAQACRVIEPAPLQRARSLESAEYLGRESPSSGLFAESSSRKGMVLQSRDRSNSPLPPANKQSTVEREHSLRRDGLQRAGGALPVNWKPGDWLCPACNDHVFARKGHCRCGEAKPSAQQHQQSQSQPQPQPQSQPAQQAGHGGTSAAPESVVTDLSLKLVESSALVMDYYTANAWNGLSVDWNAQPVDDTKVIKKPSRFAPIGPPASASASLPVSRSEWSSF